MKRTMAFLRRLHQCDQGASMVEKILIIVAVALPLLALLIIFRNKITEWTQGTAEQVLDDGQDFDPDF